ncbi:NADH-quinone oxidoreductase subunit F, partial [Enterococcus faecium]
QLFVYLRDDYVHLHAVLRRAIDEVVASGLADGLQIDLRRSGGAYICGEETALIASLEGRPARPRERPPYPTEQGYHGHP